MKSAYKCQNQLKINFIKNSGSNFKGGGVWANLEKVDILIFSLEGFPKQLKASTSHFLIIQAAFSLLILSSDPINIRKFSHLLLEAFVCKSVYCCSMRGTDPDVVTHLIWSLQWGLSCLHTVYCTPYNVHHTFYTIQ